MTFEKDKIIGEVLSLSEEYSAKYPECKSCFDTLNGLMNAAKERDAQGIYDLNIGLFAVREFDNWIPQIANRLHEMNIWAIQTIENENK